MWNEKTEAAKQRKAIKSALKLIAAAAEKIGNASELAYIAQYLANTHGVAK